MDSMPLSILASSILYNPACSLLVTSNGSSPHEMVALPLHVEVWSCILGLSTDSSTTVAHNASFDPLLS